MRHLLILALASFFAQLVDGALGMGYGLTSTSLLLAAGIAPAVASASVHAGEVVTTLASGISHWRFGNVDWEVTRRLALPGAVGAFAGALFLSNLPVNLARPAVSAFLLVLGIVVLLRPRPGRTPQDAPARPFPRRLLLPLGLTAGFLDAAGGGGWGPVTTATLMARRNSVARTVVGSVDTSEFLVALGATLGFLPALGWEGVNLTWVAAIVVGGVVAAPLAAWAVRLIPAHVLGRAVGVLIVFSNARVVLGALGVELPAALLAASLVVLAAAPAVASRVAGRLAARTAVGTRTGRAAAELSGRPSGAAASTPRPPRSS